MSIGFDRVLDLIREGAATETRKGVRFERLMQRALPLFGETNLETVLARDELTPEQRRDWKLGLADTGVDLIGIEHGVEDRWVGIQCKCHDEHSTINLPEVANFLAFAGRERCSGLILVDTSSGPLGPNLRTVVRGISRWWHIDLRRLGTIDLDWDALARGEAVERPRHRPNRVQTEAIGALKAGFEGQDRGQCLISLWMKRPAGESVLEEMGNPSSGRMRGAFPTGWRSESLARSVPPSFAGREDLPRTPPRRRFAPRRRTMDFLHSLSWPAGPAASPSIGSSPSSSRRGAAPPFPFGSSPSTLTATGSASAVPPGSG